MRKLLFLCCLLTACQAEDFGNLTREVKLPRLLWEVSGIQYDDKEDAFWMLNDSGNAPGVYLVSQAGKIIRELNVDAENIDWEDITQDKTGNLYIGNFGNNENDRTDLQILKISKEDLNQKDKIGVQKTFFSFPEQKAFPPKKMYFDVEAFFELNGSFYIFTKSRVKNQIGRTFLYKVPNQTGTFEAQRISDFTTCKNKGCWITGADISDDGKQVALVNHKSAWIFSEFEGDNFFSGKSKEIKFKHNSQKESITFKTTNQIFVADEDEAGNFKGRNLYSIQLEPKP